LGSLSYLFDNRVSPIPFLLPAAVFFQGGESFMRFADKVCIVTGGGSGIGRATSERFAAEGGKVLVVDLNPEHGNQTAHAITSGGGQAAFAKCDVGKSADVQAAVKAAVDRWGRIDVLVNNAAMMTFLPVVDLPEAD
jgi:glucose 1-dehydrogenase